MRQDMLRTLIAVALGMLASLPAAAQARVGVYPSASLAAEDVATIERAIAGQVGFAAVTLATMKDYVVAAESLGVACADARPNCLARVVAVSGLPYALHATAIDSSGRAVVRMVFVDGSGDNQHRQLDLRVRPSGAERASGIESGVAHLLTGQALTGGVRLHPDPENATVTVDGSRMLRFDLEQLDAGTRRVAVSAQGQRWEAEAEVLAGITVDVELTLVQAAEPLAAAPTTPAEAATGGGVGTPVAEARLPVLPIALLASGAVVGLVALVAGTALVASTYPLVPTPDQYRAISPPTNDGNFDDDQKQTYETFILRGQTAIGVGVAVAVLGAVAGGGLVAGGAATWAIE